MYMTTDELVERFRSDVDDPLRGPADQPDVDALWKITDVMYYMNAAASKTANTVLSLQRTFDIPIVAADGPMYKLPATYPVLDIHRAYLNVARRNLFERNLDEDRHWNTQFGEPRFYTREYRQGYIRLLPQPVAGTPDDVLTLTATVSSPPLEAGMPLPFNDPTDIHLVLLWMKALAYDKKDVDTYDPGKSKDAAAQFAVGVIARKYEAQRVRRGPGTVRFSW